VLDLELELCRLVVALDEAGAGARVRVLTCSSVRALPSDEVPGRAGRTLWGLGRVAALEHPRSWAGLVDSCAGADPAATAAALCARSDEDEIAVRGKDRPRMLVPRLTAAGGDLPGSYRPLDPAGTVLVSGAFGGIGQRVVRWLRDAGMRSFLLVSRRGAAAPGCGELVEELTADGCEVTVASADVTDATALRAAVRDVAARGGHLTGVVHAAGCSAPQNMVDVDAATYRSVWEPKVLGALALEEATEGCELQLFLCFSSVAATWGSQHLASYAAANAFLDAVCEHRRAVGLAGVSMSWGPWDVPSELFGADVLEFLQSVGLRVLDPALCVDLLDRLATGDEPHWVVCAADWPRYRDVMGARRNRPLLDRVGASTALPGQGPGPAGGLLASVGDPARSRQDRLVAAVDFLGGQVAGALGIEPGALQASANVFAIGLDSLMVMEVCSACRAGGVEVAPRELFERSTVAEWAEFLVQTLDGGAEQAEGLAASMEDPAVLEPLCALPADLAEHVEPGPATAAAPRRVLLTGATGFVGSHVLHDLLARPGVQVECLVRAASDDEALNRVVAALRARGLSTGTDRVSALAADLAEPRCGLSEAAWAALADRTEVVVHNAAVVDFVHSFEQLRAVNVDATLELLRLARTGGNVPFHFVSTYGVWGLPEGDGLRVAEDGDLRAAGRLVTGYTQTKWVADRMVGRAREAGQHAAVHRLGRVVCDSAGRSAMTEHFTSRVLKACVDLGVAPELDVALEITPADYVGRALAALATSAGSTGRDYHLVSDSRMPFLDAVAQLKRAGYRIEVVDRHEWWELLTADVEGRGSALRPVLDAVQRLIIEGEHALDLDTTHARRRLDPLGIWCPALDESLLGALVARFRQEGFLPEPTLASTS
jgi:thioester reductase-like protein